MKTTYSRNICLAATVQIAIFNVHVQAGRHVDFLVGVDVGD